MVHRATNATVPQTLPSELRRPHLTGRLADAASRVVLLIAPSGYGKTTVLAQHARVTPRLVVWLTLSPDDANPDVLGQALVDAVRRSLPDMAFSQWLVTCAQGDGLRRAARTLARDLDTLPPCDFIFDEIDVLGPDAGRWLGECIRQLGAAHRALLAGHSGDGLQPARLLAAGDAELLGPDDLVFSPQESAAYLGARAFQGDADAVHLHAEGWPASVVLTATPGLITSAELVVEALSQLPTDVEAGLPEAAVLPVWSERSAGALGCQLPAQWLLAAQRAGLPVTPLGQGRFRPHALLRGVLEERLARVPERHRALHLAAGRHAESEGEPLAALRCYHAAGQPAEATRVLDSIAPQLARRGQSALLRSLLESVPAQTLSAPLQALLAYAWVETGEVARGEVLLATQGSGIDDQPWALAAACHLAGRRGQHARQLALADRGLARQPDQVLEHALRQARALALLNLGRLDEGVTASEALVRDIEAGGATCRLGDALALWAFALLSAGRPAEREQVMWRALALHRQLDQPQQADQLLLDLADHHRVEGRAEDAAQLLSQLSASEPSFVDAFAAEVRGDLALDQAQFEGAAGQYRAALAACDAWHLQLIQGRVWLKLSEALARSGQAAAAQQALTAGRASAATGPAWLQAFLAFREGQVLFDQGQLDAAVPHFEVVARTSLERAHQPRALAYLAEISRRRAAPLTQLSAQVAEVARAAQELGHTRVLTPDAAAVPEIAQAVEQALKRGAAGRPDMTGASLTRRPQLQVVTLGGLQFRLSGQPVQPRLSKAAELLVWSALHGRARRERITGALWPGPPEARHHEYFRVAVRCVRDSLRKALAALGVDLHDPFPFTAGEYGLATSVDVQCDVEALRISVRTGEVTPALTGGLFLPHIDTPWTDAWREQASADATSQALTRAYALESIDVPAACRAYQRALDLDPLCDAAHHALMRLYGAAGQVGAQVRAQQARQAALLDHGLECR